MISIPFKNLLIRLEFSQIASTAWMAKATIEDPENSETAPVATPDVHPTRHAAGVQILREARQRIVRSTWHN